MRDKARCKERLNLLDVMRRKLSNIQSSLVTLKMQKCVICRVRVHGAMVVKVKAPVFVPQDSRSLAGTEDKETFLVTLTKPCLYVQQVAFDKGERMKT